MLPREDTDVPCLKGFRALRNLTTRPCGGCSVAAAPPGVAVGRRRAPLEPPPPQRPAPAGCSLARRRPQRHRQQRRRRREAARAVWVAFSGVCFGRRERLEGRQGSGRRQERGERSGQRMAVRRRQRLGPGGGRALLAALLLLLCVWCRAAAERVRYAIPEELGRGSLVGPLARDLGLSADELPARKLQVASGGKKQLKYFTVNEENGNLYVNERLDREEMCGASPICSVSFEALVHNPLNVFQVEVAIEDVNDNSPAFSKTVLDLEIGELIPPGAHFPLEMARDADSGSNSLLTYELTRDPSFSLSVKEKPGGKKQAGLVLERPLDREKQSSFELVLTAVDGGKPARSGTVLIRINVTDANDNPPVFSKTLYEARVAENLPAGSLVLQVQATDADVGSNGRVSYSFSNVPDFVPLLFAIDSESGEIRTVGPLDFEEENKYVFSLEATDGGGLTDHCEVQIDITDENDNAPEITILSLSSPVPEDAPVGTVVAVLNVNDPDSGENGQVSCELSGEAPLSIAASSGGSYKVVTSGALDREQASEHRVTVVARDRGRPALRSSRELVLEVSDVNDNAPVFEEAAYSAYVAENNAAGALVLRVQARDADAGANGRVSYWLAGGSAGAAGAAPLVSVEARSGALYAQRSLDYEQCREFTVAVRAQDGGSPARSSTATVRVFVLDRNDNAPRVLWPAAAAAGPGEAAGGAAAAPFEVVPRSAEAGYLVAKVVAVDADAGRNAWLSYELVQASEPALFRVGLHSGEVRTARAVGERDAAKQRLVAVVKDHGQPALSATATLHVVLAESLQEALPELSERPAGAEAAAAELQFYLVLALALLSALLVLSVALAVLARLRRAGPPAVLRCLGAQRFSLAGAAFPADFCEGTLPYSYNLCVPPPARAVPEAAWPPPPPVPILSAEELLGGDSCGKPSMNSDLVVEEPPANPDAPQVCKVCEPRPRNACSFLPPDGDTLEDESRDGLEKCGGRRSALDEKRHLGGDSARYGARQGGQRWAALGACSAGRRLRAPLLTERSERKLGALPAAPPAADRLTRLLSPCLNLRSPIVPAVLIHSGARRRHRRLRSVQELRALSGSGIGSAVLRVAAAPPGVAVGRRRAPQEPPPPQRPAPAGCSLARRRPQRQRHRQQQRRRREAARAVWVAFSGVCCARRERLEGRQGSGRRRERGERSGQRMAVRRRQRLGPGGGRALLAALLLLLCVWCRAAAERVRYAIPEELGRGSLVGPLARDLGLSADELPARKLRLSEEKQYFTVNEENGNLFVNERLDREEMCGESATCSVSFEALVQNPLNIFHVEVSIEDVNDNSPVFRKAVLDLEIGEWALPGARFPLEMARDADIGSNSLLSYQLTRNPSFSLTLKENSGGSKQPELVLEGVLDREKQSSFELVLTAVDGGEPARSGTIQVRINVTDANDNPPVFSKTGYEARVAENLPVGSLVLKIRATDADVGSNGQVSYSFGDVPDDVLLLFTIDSDSGEVRTAGPLDFEEKSKYIFGLEARDGGGLTSHCEVQIVITDENDNVPEITILLLSSPVPEDAPTGTVVAVLKVRDRDSGENGQVSCELSGEAPLSIVASPGGSYKVVTSGALDREQASEHRVTVVARDRGRPALRSSRELVLEVSDVNDNAPVFEEAAYSAYVAENNAAGALVLRVQARDADAGANGRVSYWLAGGSAGAAGAAPLVSVEARSGALYAQRSLDYEQCREFTVAVRAQDGGSPARSSTATVRVFVLDRNDNAPRVLWPAAAAAGPGEAAGGAAAAPFEVVPRSAEAGYLVAKVVAVDADAGRNAWLSYELVQASEPALFRVGLHSGEVRTARAVGERDAAKQRLVAVVKDHGQPALSATATLHVVLAESLQEALPELSERPAGAEAAAAAELQFYLVLALALLSALLVLSVALAVLARLRRAGPPAVLRCLGAQRFSLAGAAFPADFCEGTLPYSYNLCVPPPARPLPETAWPPPPPVPVLSAEELLGSDSCGKPSPDSQLALGEQPAEPDAPQVCKV
ncbi:uncharacterized protein RBU47_008454 [Passerculus sandwichensis]